MLKTIKNFIFPKKLVTHDGSFHSDDIFTAAALSILFKKRKENFKIIRTRNEKIINSGDIVFDVGGIYNPDKNKFDHHQMGGAGRRSILNKVEEENGIEYSSFGIVWKKFGVEICESQKVANLIDKKLVAPIDAFDNGFDLVSNKYNVHPFQIDHIFFALLPTWREENLDKNKIFFKCVKMAEEILSREIVQMQDTVLAEEILTDIYKNTSDKRIIVLDKNYPFEYILHNFPEPLFAVYPRKTDKTWGVKAIRENPKSFKNRKDFPEVWGGLREEEFKKITGVKDAVFCHRSLFLAVAKSKEGAIKLAQIAVES